MSLAPVLQPLLQQHLLVCPQTRQPLSLDGDRLVVPGHDGIQYPILNGIPVLINESNSLFTVADFELQKNTTWELDQGLIKRLGKKLMPDISLNIKSRRNYEQLCTLLPPDARILVIGGSIVGQGMECIYQQPGYTLVGTDVSFGPHTRLICDAHDIPFADGSFDCVIAQAVLEHVVDPERCVSEIHRVLKPDGLVYAETPFIEQVHMKQYDFKRYTHLGHRRLFRAFSEIAGGPVCGPGMALAWSYTYFLKSFATGDTMRRLLMLFAHWTSFYLKYLDYYLIDKPGSYDAACVYYFMGRRSDQVIPDREILKQFRGFR